MTNTPTTTKSDIPTMLTIRELATECKAYGISEFYIRHAVNDGKVAHIKAGRKILVNREKFIDHLNGNV
ncbi:MAG: helix-turn-helix domain-containing protein [Ruminococcaceae bacterium]|nr:helix-turn-helix domain-containing protein [Oscillospiraceae bacterium]